MQDEQMQYIYIMYQFIEIKVSQEKVALNDSTGYENIPDSTTSKKFLEQE